MKLFINLSSFRLEENTVFEEKVLEKCIFKAFCSVCSMEISVQRNLLKMPIVVSGPVLLMKYFVIVYFISEICILYQ